LAISPLVQRLNGRTADTLPPVSAPACADTSGRRTYFTISCHGESLSIIKQYINGQSRPLQNAGLRRRQTGQLALP
jgi:hypothetical protein